MAQAIIRTINVSKNSIAMECESDLTNPDGSIVFFTVSFSRQELAMWKEDNPAGTDKQFLQEKTQQIYDWYEKTLAKTSNLLNQDIFTL